MSRLRTTSILVFLASVAIFPGRPAAAGICVEPPIEEWRSYWESLLECEE